MLLVFLQKSVTGAMFDSDVDTVSILVTTNDAFSISLAGSTPNTACRVNYGASIGVPCQNFTVVSSSSILQYISVFLTGPSDAPSAATQYTISVQKKTCQIADLTAMAGSSQLICANATIVNNQTSKACIATLSSTSSASLAVIGSVCVSSPNYTASFCTGRLCPASLLLGDASLVLVSLCMRVLQLRVQQRSVCVPHRCQELLQHHCPNCICISQYHSRSDIL